MIDLHELRVFATPDRRLAATGRTMVGMRRILACFVLSGATALAQTHQHAAPEAYKVDLAKVPSAQRLDGIGQSHIPITTKSAEAQQWFDQGLALLHCFWDFEALRAFHEAVQVDPNCAMCHWGLAQALDFNPANQEQAKQELQKAKELAEHASDREQRYIRAYTEQQDKQGEEGEKAFTKEMER